MANVYGTNPIVLDTAPYTTGTIGIPNGSSTLTGSGTTWTTATHPGYTQGNQDRVTEISVDSGVIWYAVQQRDSNTQLTLQTTFGETTIASGASYLTRLRLIPRIKINKVVWTNPTANDEFILRDKGHNPVVFLRAGTTEMEQFDFGQAHWVDGLNFTAIPSGTVYIYYE